MTHTDLLVLGFATIFGVPSLVFFLHALNRREITMAVLAAFQAPIQELTDAAAALAAAAGTVASAADVAETAAAVQTAADAVKAAVAAIVPPAA